MVLVGIADVAVDWRMRVAERKKYKIFGASDDAAMAMQNAAIETAGTLDDLLSEADIVVDCTPKRIATGNVEEYRRRNIKFIVQGGEKHDVTGHSQARRIVTPRSRHAVAQSNRPVGESYWRDHEYPGAGGRYSQPPGAGRTERRPRY